MWLCQIWIHKLHNSCQGLNPLILGIFIPPLMTGILIMGIYLSYYWVDFPIPYHTVDGWNPVNSPVEVGSLSPLFSRFYIHPRWLAGFYRVLAPSKRWLFEISALNSRERASWAPRRIDSMATYQGGGGVYRGFFVRRLYFNKETEYVYI